MGSKGTSTQTQAGTSTYTPSAATQAAGTQALTAAQSAASSPFQLPVAPVAGFTPDQLQAFQQTQQQQGIAQPYFDQSQQLFNQSAAPITGAQVNQYMNPYSSYVLQNLANTQGQQMNQLTGQATQQAGGVGADRIGVAQGELANQQNLATGQTLSGIYGSALSAAQQNAQMQQSAAYGIGNLGGAVQNAATQGTQNLYNMGSQQQQLNQAQLNAPYQNQLAQIAFPYQNAQYLAGITGSLAGALGGTTQSNQYGTAQAAPPSILSQIAGAGTAAAGAYGVYNSLGGNANVGAMPATGAGSPTDAQSNAYALSQGINPNARGGRIEGFASGGDTTGSGEPAWMTADPTIPMEALHASQVVQPKIQPLNMSSGSGNSGSSDLSNVANIAGSVAKLAPLLLASRGGAIDGTPYQGYADGGETVDYVPQDFEGRFNDAATMGQIERPRFAESATMGEMPRAMALAHLLKDREGTVASNDSPVGGQPPPPVDPPYRMPPPVATQAWRDSTPVPEADDTTPANTKPTVGGPTGMAALSPGAAAAAAANKSDMQKATVNLPYPDLDHTNNTSRDITRNPWLALVSAGLGIMGGTSPYAGINIGKGAQAGVETLMKQREADKGEEEINQRAKQLALEADKHLRQYTQLTPAAAATIENQKKQRELEETKIEAAGWEKGGENLLTGETTWFNPRTQESGLLKRDGTWVPAGKPNAGSAPPAGGGPTPAPAAPPAVAGPSAGVAPAPPTPPGATPPAAPAAPSPAPYGEPSLASNLTPPRSDIGYISKGSPMGQAANKELQTTITAQNKAAQSLPALEQDLSAMKMSYKTLTRDADKDGFLQQLALQPGANFGDRLERAKQANAIAIAAGNKPPFDPDKVAAAENINKIQNRMGLTFSSQISPREAFSGQKIGIESSPGLTNSPKGFQRLIAGFDAATQNTRDEQAFFQSYLAKNGHALGWRQAFNAQNPSERYVVKGLIGTLPEPLQKGLPEAVAQLKSDPKKYKDIFNKHYNDTADYFLGHQ